MPACMTIWRTAALAAAGLMLALAGPALAGGGAAHGASAAPASGVAGGDNCGCAPGGRWYNFPPPNISVQALGVANANASAQSAADAQAQARATAGGVGGGWVEQAPGASLVQGLDVETGDRQVRRVSYQATRKVVRKVLIEAECLDDRGAPHPASQVHPGRDVADDYDGEIFRCLAGTRMQATIGDYSDSLVVQHGQVLTCEKMQALWHSPDGRVACKAQIPRRDCNERSLLRRYGPGVKALTLVREETYTAYRDETTTSETRKTSGVLTLDGGVGGFH